MPFTMTVPANARSHHRKMATHDQLNGESMHEESEVDALRQKVASQQEQLQQKEVEIRRLQQQQQQEGHYSLALSQQHSARDRAHSALDESDCCFNVPYMTHDGTQRLSPRDRHSRGLFRCRSSMTDVLRMCLVGFLIFYMWTLKERIDQTHPLPEHWVSSPESRPVTTPTTTASGVNEQQPVVPKEEPKKPTPQTSQPPKPVELYAGLEPDSAIYKRHQCIAQIRERQTAILGPLVTASSEEDAKILLVDPAYHSNVGDHMLTLGEIVFMTKMGYKRKNQNECHLVQAGEFVPHCNNVLWAETGAEQGLALWHAGGNWGDLWRDAQTVRIESFQPLLEKNFTIISMPQSFHYGDLALDRSDTEDIQRYITQGLWSEDEDPSILDTKEGKELAQSRVVFTWREHESYEVAVKRYPFATNLIVPDIAFQLGPFAAPVATDDPLLDMVIFLRDDHESVVQEGRSRHAVRDIMEQVLDNPELISFTIVDWKDRLERFESTDYFFTDTSIQLLAVGHVLICDRLHAAILAYLAGIPFVYINQATGKVGKTLRVAFESGKGCEDGEAAMWARADNLTHAIQQADMFLRKYDLKPDRKRRKRKSGPAAGLGIGLQ